LKKQLTEINPVEKHFLDKASEANFGLWNALLTVNGILVSAFSLLLTLRPSINKALVTFLVISCAISIFLIVWNYLTTKWHYKKIGQRLVLEKIDLSENQRQSDINNAYRRHKFIEYREYIALILLLLEMALIFLIVFSLELHI